MTLFTVALIVEIMSLLTLQMWRIVSSLCSQELKELMEEVSNDFLYIYLPICASFEFFYLQSCIYYLLITIKYTKILCSNSFTNQSLNSSFPCGCMRPLNEFCSYFWMEAKKFQVFSFFKGSWRRKIVVGFSIFSLIFTGFLMDSLNSKPCSYFSRNVQLLSLIFHSKLFSCSFQFMIKFSLRFFFMFHQFRYHFAKKESHNSSCSSSTQFSRLSVVHSCLMI